MTSLKDQHCKPCEGGVEPLTKSAALALMNSIDERWQLSADGLAIVREFSFNNFYKTMAFVNAIAFVANGQGHHPDLEVGYGRCHVTYTTHAINGLSDNDFICAARIDALDG
ncbi:MAG: 4a-hydroxytetrahydrobiopterin dehydratase [Gammaproteobacteria bacterium]